MATINYAIDCGVDVVSFFIAVPYPGSELYDVYKQNNLLPQDVECRAPDRWIGNIIKATIDTCELSAGQVGHLYKEAQKQFRAHRRRRFLNPFYLAHKIHSWDDFKFVMRMFPQGFRQYFLLKNSRPSTN